MYSSRVMGVTQSRGYPAVFRAKFVEGIVGRPDRRRSNLLLMGIFVLVLVAAPPVPDQRVFDLAGLAILFLVVVAAYEYFRERRRGAPRATALVGSAAGMLGAITVWGALGVALFVLPADLLARVGIPSMAAVGLLVTVAAWLAVARLVRST